MRRDSFRLVALSSLAAAGLTLLPPGWVRAVGLDAWSVSGHYAVLRQEAAVRARLAEAEERKYLRLRLTETVLSRLARGQSTLAAAAGEVEGLYREYAPDELEALLVRDPTQVIGSRVAVTRYVVVKLREAMADDPSRQAEVAARLRAEINALVLGPADRAALLAALADPDAGAS